MDYTGTTGALNGMFEHKGEANMNVREIWSGYSEKDREEIFSEMGWGRPPAWDSVNRPDLEDIYETKNDFILDTSLSEVLWDSGNKKDSRTIYYRTRKGRVFKRYVWINGGYDHLTLMDSGNAWWMKDDGVPKDKIMEWMGLEEG